MKLHLALSVMLMLIVGTNEFLIHKLLTMANGGNLPNNKIAPEGDYSSPSEAASFLKEKINYSSKDESQSIEFKSGKYYLAKLTQKTSGFMGKSSTESKGFYPAHINPGSSEIDVSGDIIYINYSTKDRKSLIQEFEAGTIQGYNDELKIMCDDIQEARDIKSALNYLISEAQPEKLSLTSTSKAMDWLTKNVKKVEAGKTTYKQTLTFSQADDNKITLKVSEISKKNTTKKRYELYMADLVAERLEVKVGGGMFGSGFGGDVLQLRIFTSNDREVITYYENGERDGFENKVAVSFTDPLRALRAKKALFKAIKHSKEDNADYSASSGSSPNTRSEEPKEQTKKKEVPEESANNSPDEINRPDMDYEKMNIPKPDYYGVPMIYDVDKDELISLERDQMNVSTRRSGMFSGEKLTYVDGTSSPVKFDNDERYILLLLLESARQDPKETIMLYKYQVNDNRNQREYIVGKGNSFTGGTKSTKESQSIQFKKLGEGFYAIEFEMKPGEYFLSKKDDKTFFSFGVEP